MDTRENARVIVDLLNELYSLDPEAAAKLAFTRFECNDAVAEHPRFQVREEQGRGWAIGVIGFLNGLFDADHRVTYEYDYETGGLLGFRVLSLVD